MAPNNDFYSEQRTPRLAYRERADPLQTWFDSKQEEKRTRQTKTNIFVNKRKGEENKNIETNNK